MATPHFRHVIPSATAEDAESLRAIVDATPDAVASVDAEGRIAEWNTRAERQFGWKRPEAIGRLLDDVLFRPADRAAVQDLLRQLVEEDVAEGTLRRDVTVLHRDGREQSLELVAVAAELSGGTLVNLFFRDASERRRIERQLTRHTLEARLLCQAALLATETDSFEEALKRCVDIICELTGWPVGHAYVPSGDGQELIPTTIWHLRDEQGCRRFRQATESTCVAHGQGLPGQIWATGEPVWMSDIRKEPVFRRSRLSPELPLRGAFGFPVRVRGETVAVLEFFTHEELAPDPHLLLAVRGVGEQVGRVLERKRAEDALRGSEDRFRFTLRAARIGVWEWNPHSGQVCWTHDLEAEGGPQGDCRSGPFDEFLQDIHPEDREEVRRALTAALDADTEYRVEYRILRDGGARWIAGKGRAVTDEQTRRTRMAGVCLDITDRKQWEAELRQAKEAAEAGNRARSEFLANMSHELRTPMNAIVGMTELALGEEVAPTVRDYLTTARESASHLMRLLGELLDFSEMEAGRFALGSTPFSLRETLDEVMKSLADQAAERGLELGCDVVGDVPDDLVGDPVRLRHVLANLVGNAIKFTPQGEVLVRAAVESRTSDEVGLHFVVADTGIGISPGDCQRIFRAFSQVDSSTTRQFPGTGIGLAIASELISMMGGRIWVESELGRGSEFHFTARFLCHTERSDDRERRWETLRGVRVLVVDDNATNRRIVRDAVTHWGMRPDEAADGETALRMLREAAAAGDPFVVLLLDAQMPHMDGFELARQVQSDPDLKGPTVLMLSSVNRQTAAEQADGLGIAAYLQKPISQLDLLHALVTTLEQVGGGRPFEPAPRQHGLRVLLAEDTPANLKLVVTILEKRGHEVAVARNGREVLDQFGRQDFDVILMDVQMPLMDGLQATAAIRAQEESPQSRIPIIAMTAHALRGDRERCLAAGMDAYLPKPIDVAKTVELVESLAPPTRSRPMNAAETAPAETVPADTPSADTPAAPVFVREIALRRMGDNEQLFRELVQFFQEDAADLLGRLRAAVAQQNAEELERGAHSLKGLAANFEARPAADVAYEVEKHATAADFPAAAETLDRLEREIGRLCEALRESTAT